VAEIGASDMIVGVGAATASAGTRFVAVIPDKGRDATEVVVPRVSVDSSPIGPTRGSQAPAPIGPPSWARTVGRLFR
jgi:hypothetical protein